MALQIANWFLEVFQSEYLSVFLISIVPMIEVRGAIPIGVSMGMNIWVSYVFATLSALVIAPVLILILKPVLKWLKKTKIFKKIAFAVEDMFSSRAGTIENKLSKKTDGAEGDPSLVLVGAKTERKNLLKKMIGVFLFVAVPLPMTGVWTGTAVAVFLNLKWHQILPPIVVGNFVAGAIITALTVALGDKVSIILYVLFAFVLVSIAVMLFGMYRRSKKRKKEEVQTAAVTENTPEDPSDPDGNLKK